MPLRPSHLAILAAALTPLVAGCGEDKRPVTTTVSSSPATVAVVDSSSPEAFDSATAAATAAPVSYSDAETAYTGRRYDEAVDLFAAYTSSNPANPCPASPTRAAIATNSSSLLPAMFPTAAVGSVFK